MIPATNLLSPGNQHFDLQNLTGLHKKSTANLHIVCQSQNKQFFQLYVKHSIQSNSTLYTCFSSTASVDFYQRHIIWMVEFILQKILQRKLLSKPFHEGDFIKIIARYSFQSPFFVNS